MGTPMRLLLLKNIEHLGNLGDVVDVTSGYARNYLEPQGYGVKPTKHNLKIFESEKRRLIAREEERKSKYQVLAKELEKASCTIIANSTEEGHLYGSVTPREIAAQLATEDLQVDPKSILLEEPIKEIGIYKVLVQLHPGVECRIKVWVVKGDESSVPDDVDLEQMGGEGEDSEEFDENYVEESASEEE